MDDRNRQDPTRAAVMWAAVTALTVAATYFFLDPFPTRGAEEAEFIDHAFMVLTYLAAPVFGLVVAVLAYSVLRFRARGQPTEDGPAIFGRGPVPWVWLALTSTLAVVVMIYPGLTGLADLRSDEPADLEVDITAFRFGWKATYVESGVEVVSPAGVLTLPVDSRVRFNVTALESDVLHSFWVPAFRMKADAVPGYTQTIYITPDRIGGPDDIAYRVQCAEMCGLLHSQMTMQVRVVAADEFARWLETQSRSAAAAR